MRKLSTVVCLGSACFFLPAVPATAAPKVLPVLNHPIADRSGLAGSPFTVNLNDAFGTEAIDDQVVRFTSQFSSAGIPVVLDVALFSHRTPVTRGNFLTYVADEDYANSFIHRSVPGFVLQGGGYRFNDDTDIISVPTDEPIVNEFGVSNTISTIAMAKLGGDPNSATSQWFVSLGANSDILDSQNGGFTVFGRITRSTFGNAQIFGNPSVFPVYDYSSLIGSPFGELPLFHTHVPTELYRNQFIEFPTVSQVPLPAGEAGEVTVLSYSIVSNTNPTVAAASILPNGLLSLDPAPGQTGSTTITVRATDSVGNTVDDTFSLTVNTTDTYATWASRTAFDGNATGATENPDGDEWNNLQEFAFLGDPSTVDATGQTVSGGKVGSAPAGQFVTLTFPVRKETQGLTYVVEGNDTLSGTWTEIWNSTNGFSHAQVVSAVDQADRTVVTIRDTADIVSQPRRFLRTRVMQQ